MSITPFKKIRTSDPSTEELQRAVESPLKDISSRMILDGQILKDVALSNGDNTINHKLQRTLVGWIPIRLSAAVTLYDKQATNAMPDLTLVLNSTGSATVSIWVF